MEKIKFRNLKKYKGIVEKVYVKDGQPVKKDELLAVITTQLERSNITSPIDGVIRNVYIIESLIVSHGDTVFDVFTDFEINTLLKKPSSINDTLREGLNEFGYLEKLINKESFEDLSKNNKNYISVDSVTQEMEKFTKVETTSNNNDNNFTTETVDDFDIYFDSETAILNAFDNQELINKNIEIEREVILNPVSISDSITEELAWHSKKIDILKKGIDLKIFEENNLKAKETKINDEIENQQILPAFNDEIVKSENIIESSQSVESEDNLTANEFKIKFETNETQINDFDESNLENAKILKIQEIESLVDEKILLVQNELSILNKNNIKFNDLAEKFNLLKKELEFANSKISKIKLLETDLNELKKNTLLIGETNSKIELLENQFNQIKFENQDLKNEIKKISNTSNSKVLMNSSNNQVSYVDFSIDITALINLHTLMIEPSKKNDIWLELNAFFAKALKKSFIKFKELKIDSDYICLIQNNKGKLVQKNVEIFENSSILDIAKNIENYVKNENNIAKISLFDLTNTNINNAKLNLYEQNIITIYFSKITHSFKEDGILSSYLNLCFAFNEDIIAFEEMIKFTSYFVNLLRNPGFLI
ncbi:biotin/lipoyl-containing protein [Spiroplasma taiwanense]|uniref:biotin/lipoyl-containing protein n=1 Tax=Spiroplasma taiwanense TaxID=2145 RepID=UPI0005A232C6|nr:biotin/lipoyl-binding protein [Spiroplasma taiwanense]